MAQDTTNSSIHASLAEIQGKLNAPKGQFNKFGGYAYRSCEDILQAVKPLLGSMVITITDDLKMLGDRVYVVSTATITDGVGSVSTTAFAREPLSAKGKDESQITGSASSYARKYALNGLLLIDDNKDADSQDNREQGQPKPFNAAAAEKAIRGAKDRATVDTYLQAAQHRGATQEQMAALQQAAMDRLGELEA